MAESAADRRDDFRPEISCRASACAALCFEHLHGREGVRRVLARMGTPITREYLTDPRNFTSFAFSARFLDELVRECGDPDFPRKAGLFVARPEAMGFVWYWFRALGTPRRAYRALAELGGTYNRAGIFRIEALSDRRLVLRYTSKEPEPNRNLCLARGAQMASIPTLWDLPPAQLREHQCQVQGADACVYELTWVPAAHPLWSVALAALAGAGVAWAILFFATGVPPGAELAIGALAGLAAGQAVQWRRSEKLLREQSEATARSLWDLQSRHEEIERLNRTLEQKVEERTRELHAATQELRRDIAERERAEAALHEAHRRKDEFLAMLSHELRNPLSAVRNSLRVLAGAPPEAAEPALAIAERQTAQLSRMVDDLLDVTRIERGKLRLECAPLDLAGLVRRAVEDHRAALAGRELVVRLPDGPLAVRGDAARLAQVLGNLLDNASKFTPAGGRVTVRLSGGQGRATLEVEDTGAGIDPAMLPRLFEPLAQADRTLDRAGGGLGLGLAVVRGIVELHGGEAAVHSDGPGRGARATVTLPLTEDPPPAPAPSAPALAGAGRRVLVVEDNRDVAESLRAVLAADGFEVAVARAGPEALAHAREHRPPIILCDIGLPGMDGYTVARQLRREGGGARPWLVALTGYARPEDRQRAKEAGFDAHLAKPATIEDIQRALAGAPTA